MVDQPPPTKLLPSTYLFSLHFQDTTMLLVSFYKCIIRKIVIERLSES